MLNLSGKRDGFVTLDMFNEYIVREVKNLIANVVTEETDEHLRNVLSPLVMTFWEIRRKMAEETDANIFDFHSTPVNSWVDIRRIANSILKARLFESPGERDGFYADDHFIKGIHCLANTVSIEKLKKALIYYEECEIERDGDYRDHSDDEINFRLETIDLTESAEWEDVLGDDEDVGMEDE